MAKKCVLFFAEAVTLAHAARPVVLAQALNPDLYDIYLAWDPRFRKLFPSLPFAERFIHSIPSRRFINALAKGKPLYDVQTLRAYVAEDLNFIEEVSPDLVVGDFRLSLAVSAAISNIPYMTISNAYWSPYARQQFPVPDLPVTRILGPPMAQALFNLVRPLAFAYHTVPLNRVRREHGLPSLGYDLPTLYTYADYTLYADIPEVIPTVDRPASHHYLGPVLWSPTVLLPDWWDSLPHDRPIIYVTLGSSGPSDLLPVVLSTLAPLPVTVIAATAGHFHLDYPPDNVFIADYLPGEAAVRRADLVICNGGSPATQQALAGGVPVLGIATNMDQHLNMASVQRSGAGERLRSEQVTVSLIGEAVNKLLNNVSYAQAAKQLAQLSRSYDASSRFRALVAEVIQRATRHS